MQPLQGWALALAIPKGSLWLATQGGMIQRRLRICKASQQGSEHALKGVGVPRENGGAGTMLEKIGMPGGAAATAPKDRAQIVTFHLPRLSREDSMEHSNVREK